MGAVGVAILSMRGGRVDSGVGLAMLYLRGGCVGVVRLVFSVGGDGVGMMGLAV